MTVEPHRERTLRILKEYPEVKKLFGPTPTTSFFVFLSVGLQLLACYLLSDAPIWVIFFVAYVVGAVINHGMWALVHELTHDLVFKGEAWNKALLLVANFPLFFPASMAFRKYHVLHHRYQGQVGLDADLPADFEKTFVGKSMLRKSLWLLFYFAFQSTRVMFIDKVNLWDRWVVLNWITQVLFLAVTWYFLGPYALLYLFFSGMFSIGLHPVGARWIQEHYLIKPDQETYSYYGPMNFFSYNVGYHNEHHDFMSVPWSRLKQVKKMAPAYYDNLYCHKSWGLLLWKFLTDPDLNLESRRTR